MNGGENRLEQNFLNLNVLIYIYLLIMQNALVYAPSVQKRTYYLLSHFDILFDY